MNMTSDINYSYYIHVNVIIKFIVRIITLKSTRHLTQRYPRERKL